MQNWKHVIGSNNIIPFNEELDFNSTSIIDIVNIHESFHEEVIVIFIKNKDLNKTKNSSVTEDDYTNWFGISSYGKSIYNDPNIFMVSWWVTDSYFNGEKLKVVIFKLWMLHMVHQDHLDKQ